MGEEQIIEQSAVFAYRKHKGNLQILLVTSRDSQRWVLPKGHVKEDLSPRESAALEAYEEAGIKGNTAKKPIGYYGYVKTVQKGENFCRVSVFPMKVSHLLDKWPEMDIRKRKWMAIGEAIKIVDEKQLKKLIDQFYKEIKTKWSRSSGSAVVDC